MTQSKKSKVSERTKVIVLLGLIFIFSGNNYVKAASPSIQNRSTHVHSSEHTLPTDHAAEETQAKLTEVEQHRQAIHEQAQKIRRKEQLALAALSKIKTKLQSTNKALEKHQHKLSKTVNNLHSCESTLNDIASKEEMLSEEAAKRLRQMYEGQRLGLLEMLFEVGSLQQLMDLLYYQERIASADRSLIEELRSRVKSLSVQKNLLDFQKIKLGDLISAFAQKAFMLKKEKSEQETVAEKLRTQRAFYEEAEQQLARESSQLEQQIVAMTKAGPSNKLCGSGNMGMPICASITSPFGWRRHPIFGIRKFHTGIDLAGPNHSPIRASDTGNVLYTGWYGGYGKVVIVDHGNGKATLYAHLSRINTTAGQNIKKGDVIGYEGSTGFSTGPHLHFEVRVDGKPNNPLNFVR